MKDKYFIVKGKNERKEINNEGREGLGHEKGPAELSLED
ncbi:hypothetical protein L581_0572 [Serratia fonticola AU-AP2C]|nr:hypothetical protein L581_0572 [Serratia fonticola AU-AP2C]